MTAVILSAIGLVVLWVAWRWQSSRSAVRDPTDPMLRTALDIVRLSRSDPEAAKRLLDPLVPIAEEWYSALKARANSDPIAATEYHAVVKEQIANAETAVHVASGKDAMVVSRMKSELEALWAELSWAEQRMRGAEQK